MHMRKRSKRVIAALLVGLLSAESAMACTRVLWAAPDGQVLVGRNQDWTEKANSSFRVYPRGIERTGAVAENPHKWTSRYGSLVVSAYDMGTHEGVNEKGLSAHALYLAVEAAFGERDPKLEAELYLEAARSAHENDLLDDLKGQSCTPRTLRRVDWLLAHTADAATRERLLTQRRQAQAWQHD